MADHSALSPPTADALRARLRQGVTWNMVGTLASQGSAFLASIIVANMVGQVAFGQFSIILSSILTLTGLAQVATGVTATRYVAEHRSSDKSRTSRVLGLCAVVAWLTGVGTAAALALSAPWIADHALSTPHLARALAIGAIAVLFSTVNGFQAGALAGLESYRVLAIVSIAQGGLHLILCSVGTWLAGVEGAIVGLSASAFIRWALFAQLLTREASRAGVRPTMRGLQQERHILYRFALPAAASGLTSLPALWVGQALVARLPGGYAELGLYAAANNLRVLVLFLPLILNNVGMSLLNNQVGADNEWRYRRVFWTVLGGTALTCSVGAIAVAALGPWFLSLFGNSFVEGHTVLMILLASTLAEALSVASYQVMQSHEKMWLSLFCVSLPRDLLIVALAWLLIPIWGASGLATAYALAWTVALAVIALIVCKLGLRLPSASRRAVVTPTS